MVSLIETSPGAWLVQLFVILLFLAIVTLVVWGISALVRGGVPWGHSGGPSDPEQILKERLARGEIDPEEYLRLRVLIVSDDAHRRAGR